MTKGFYLFHKVDKAGFWYADHHTNLRRCSSTIRDGFGNMLFVAKIEEFVSREQVLAKMTVVREEYRICNLIKDSNFIDRGKRPPILDTNGLRITTRNTIKSP